MAKININKEDNIDIHKLYEELLYIPESGYFLWNIARPGVKKGKRAGSIKVDGYRKIRFNKEEYLEHRLAWFYYYGTWPTNILDHIDGNKQNNSILNLRESTTRKNSFNRLDNSEYGPNIYKIYKNYCVQLQLNNKTYRYGVFTLDKAIIIRIWLLEYLEVFNSLPKDNEELLKLLEYFS
jgi:HNH endonuclease